MSFRNGAGLQHSEPKWVHFVRTAQLGVDENNVSSFD